MLTANELRTRQNSYIRHEDEQCIAEHLDRAKKDAINFANTVINKELSEKTSNYGNNITWLFSTDHFGDGYYMSKIPLVKRAKPVKEIVVATKAHRLEGISGYFWGIDLDALKEYLEEHGYRVTLKACKLEEESWSRKTTYVHQGFKMVISWEE